MGYHQLSVPSPPPPPFPPPPSIHLSSCRGGKLRTSEFAVADKGPRQGVLPEWVPQLQLHMLCAGEVDGCVGWGTARGKESWLAGDRGCLIRDRMLARACAADACAAWAGCSPVLTPVLVLLLCRHPQRPAGQPVGHQRHTCVPPAPRRRAAAPHAARWVACLPACTTFSGFMHFVHAHLSSSMAAGWLMCSAPGWHGHKPSLAPFVPRTSTTGIQPQC